MITVQTFIKNINCFKSNFPFNRVFVLNFSNETMTSNHLLSDLNSLFSCGVRAVQPKNILNANKLTIDKSGSKMICNFPENRMLVIGNINNKRCHLVGFGKAVYGMASELSKVLGDRLKSGIISVPLNIQKTFPNTKLPTTIKVCEGAQNNLPDENAQMVAKQIVQFLNSLTSDDLLFVLVSGGGSALLPIPCEGVNLNEKLAIIKNLAGKGATISELNRVRIDLSQTKGGKLASYAQNADTIVTFIISDVIGNPIDLIASGPTVQPQNCERIESSIDILKRFELWSSLPEHIQKAIRKQVTTATNWPKVENVQNIIIANNEIAVEAILQETIKRNVIGIVLSTEIEGNVADISKAYYELSKCIQAFKYGQIDENQFHQHLTKLRQPLHMQEYFLQNIINVVNESITKQIDLCVIGAGEPTVTITGNGLGGRNQELALRFSQFAFDDYLTQHVFLLSAGTDGIDGKLVRLVHSSMLFIYTHLLVFFFGSSSFGILLFIFWSDHIDISQGLQHLLVP